MQMQPMMRGGSLWFSCYLLTGSAIVAQYVREAYTRATDVCEMYPSFAFGETLREELWDHSTLLPVVHRPIATLTLLALYALAFVVMHFNLLELACLLLAEMLSGRWIHHALFIAIPSYLPFLAAEPGVPELISDGEENENDLEFREEFGGDDSSLLAAAPVNATECHRALEKLVQVKLQFADREIPRPDDWLVFDPQEGLVLHKKKMQKRLAKQVDPSLANGEQQQQQTQCGAASTLSGPKEHEENGVQSQDPALSKASSAAHKPVENGYATNGVRRR